MNRKLAFALTALALSFAFGTANGHTEVQLSGQKLDSGLGDLPHYSMWIDPTGRNPLGTRVIGESLDSGLGELPHYSKWVDKTGRNPLGREQVAAGTQRR
jgi:hypothetical protein